MKRYENREVKIQKPLDVVVWTCDNCGLEITTSRDIYFGDERLIIEGRELPWYQIGLRASKQDYVGREPTDLCSRECLLEWAARQPSIEWQVANAIAGAQP